MTSLPQAREAERPQEETIVSVERAFAVVEALADAGDGLSLSDIARLLSVNKAIASKILNTLSGLGYVWRDELSQTFQLTYRISNLSLRKLQQSRLLGQCSAALRALAEESGELARLAVVEHGERITWVHAAVGRKRTLQIDPNYGLDICLNTHAVAKAWLATLPFERALALILRQGVKALTPHSRINIEDIRADLEETRRRGFAFSYEEHELGVGAVAAAIVIPTLGGGRVGVGAVSLAAPTVRVNREELAAMGPLVIQTVERLAAAWPLDERPRMSATAAASRDTA